MKRTGDKKRREGGRRADEAKLIEAARKAGRAISVGAPPQQVRTTLSLSPQLRRQMKDMGRIRGMKLSEVLEGVAELLKMIAESGEGREQMSEWKSPPDTERRTFLMRKRTVNELNQLSESLGVPRDALVHHGVELLEILIREDAYTKAAELINPLWEKAEEVEKQLEKILPEGDEALVWVRNTVVNLMNASMACEEGGAS